MNSWRQIRNAVTIAMAVTTTMSIGYGAAPETFTATATVKTAGGATATAPITVTIERVTAQPEVDTLLAAFKTGGAAALRKALEGVPPTGSIKLGGGALTRTRVTIERTTDKGRLVTMLTDSPILLLGAGLPGAKPKDGYDFAVLDLEVDARGSGSGTLSPAARIRVAKGAFVVDDYSSEPLRLTAVAATK
jgi:hypothetical protein